MKITHPVQGFSGYARSGDYGLHFLAGVASDKAANIPAKVRAQMESEGFTFEDERRSTSDDSPAVDPAVDTPAAPPAPPAT